MARILAYIESGGATELFEEELLADPAAMADAVIRRLHDAGFEIRPAEYPKRR